MGETVASEPIPSSVGGRAAPGRSGGAQWRRSRYLLTRALSAAVVRVLFRLRVEGRERLPPGSCIVCFSHQSWADPFMLAAALPLFPPLFFFGPKEADMSVGTRNRLMTWSGMTVPYRPDRSDLRPAARRVAAILDSGAVLAIAGEGRIHAGEAELLPLDEGTAYFALRSGVPIVPVAVNGTSWLAFGRRVRIRIGAPIGAGSRPTHDAVRSLTERTWTALHELCAGYPDPRPPRQGTVWHRLTEVFNDWPEGSRPGSGGSPA